MKKVTAVMGSPQKRASYQALQEFEKNLKSYGEIDFEYVHLKDYHLEYCKGCCLCFNKGEEHCPLKDDRDVLFQKLLNSDGVIFASPSYSFQVTALMKNLLDRMAFYHHRPRFFGKTFTAVVNYGIFGGTRIEKYLETMGRNFGFSVTRGCSLMTLEPRTEHQQIKISRKIRKASMRFYKRLMLKTPPSPSFYHLAAFRLSRTGIRLLQDDTYRDYRHYQEMGWFDSGYYYWTHLGFIKKLTGHIFDLMGKRMAKHIK